MGISMGRTEANTCSDKHWGQREHPASPGGQQTPQGWHPGYVSQPRKENGVTENPFDLRRNLASPRFVIQARSRLEMLKPGNTVSHPILYLFW